MQSNRLRKFAAALDSLVPIPLDRICDIREYRSFFFLQVFSNGEILSFSISTWKSSDLLCSNPSPLAIPLHSPVEFSHHSHPCITANSASMRRSACLSVQSDKTHWVKANRCCSKMRAFSLGVGVSAMLHARGHVYIKVVYTKYTNQPIRDRMNSSAHDRQYRFL